MCEWWMKGFKTSKSVKWFSFLIFLLSYWSQLPNGIYNPTAKSVASGDGLLADHVNYPCAQ